MSSEIDEVAHHLCVITAQGLLKRVTTPFKALVVVAVEELHGNRIYMVSAVITDEDKILNYRVEGKQYKYFHFLVIG
jgi:hypothetical protein